MSLGVDKLLKEVEKAVSDSVEEKCQTFLNDFRLEVESSKNEIKDIVKDGPLLVLKGNEKHKVEGLKHKKLETLIKLVDAGQNVLLVGPAGTGKTKSAEQVSEALGLPFGCISVGSQTSKSDLLGYMDANGNYVSTEFRRAYENGGIFCMDEIDAGNSNVLIVLNSALSNGVCSFPDKVVKVHENFRFIGTANTYGNGADRMYVGRNQLDSATLDRFIVLDWYIDESLENAMEKPYKKHKEWLRAVRRLRDEVNQNQVRAVISPRMTMRCLVAYQIGNTVEDVVDMCIMPQIPSDKKDHYRKIVLDGFYGRSETPEIIDPADEDLLRKYHESIGLAF